jgi:apolipoprotein N-acyltransferase
MARVRAIEGGFTPLRAVRWAPSAAFDAHGRVRAWMKSTGDGVSEPHQGLEHRRQDKNRHGQDQ